MSSGTIELRQLTLDDYAAYKTLRVEAFENGRRPDNLDPPVGWVDSVRLGLFDGAKLAAITAIHPMTLVWGDRDAPAGGIADVACAMTQRGRGHAGALMRETLRRMHDSGRYLSGLGPFSYTFYQRYGWEWVGEMRRITLPTEIVPAAREDLDLETYEGSDALNIVKPLYMRFARKYRGMCDRVGRDPDWWDQRLGPDNGHVPYVHVVRDPSSGDPSGYMTFRHPQGGDTARIGDFVAFDAPTYRALLSILHYCHPLAKRVIWEAPMDDPLPLHIMHRELEQSIAPLFMGRIVGAAAALEALTPAAGLEGKLRIRVRDAECSWNHQTFAIEAAAGRVTASPIANDAGIDLDIRALSQAYWGYPSLSMLRAAGRIDVRDEPSYELLTKLLPPAIAFLQNWF